MTITEALDIQLARVRSRYAKTPLPRFFSWWAGELLGMLPTRWRALFAERSEALLLEIRDRQLIVWRQSGNSCSEAGNAPLDAPTADRRTLIDATRGRVDDPNLRTFYCIGANRTLRRNFTLPLAAENNLRQVLVFEMDRQTPFKADQVYFDYRTSHDKASRNIQVDLTVVPRAQLDIDLGVLSADGIVLDGVDCWKDIPGSGRLGLNLLPVERRVKRRNARLRLNLGLAAAAVVLLLTVMLQSLDNRQSALDAMTQQVEKAQNAAKQVSALKKTLQDTIASANFLNHKKQDTPVMIDMLNDLTARLPDDTYIERLSVDEKSKVDLQGLSDNTSKLIEGLQKSEVLENASFQGTIQQDPRTKKDRFNMTLEFRKKGDVEAPKSERKPGREGTRDPNQRRDGARDEGGKPNAPAA